eukprot:Em0001g2345a
MQGNDVFLILPTGSGKSLCFSVLPFAFDYLYGRVGSIVIVVSPLIALMKDQVTALNSKVDEVHSVPKWGDFFRQEFRNLGAVRSLIPSHVHIMAMTATATTATRENVITSLGLIDTVIVSSSPDKPNISYSVRVKASIEDVFTPLVDKLRAARCRLPRQEFTEPVGAPNLAMFRLVDMYTAPDEFDAVSVQNVGSTYIIVSWDLPTHSNGILINFVLQWCSGGCPAPSVISYNTTGLLLFTLYMYMSSNHAHRHCTPVGTWCWASSVLQPACPDLIRSYLGTLPQDPKCILLQLSSLLVEHTAPNIHDSNKHKRFHTLFDLLKYGLMLKYNVMCSSLDPMEELTASPPYPIPQLEQDVGMGHLSSHPLPQTGNPGSITEIECTLLSGSAEQDALQ